MDVWRPEGDDFVHSWKVHFTTGEGYQKAKKETISVVLKKSGLGPKDFAKVVLYTPDARSSRRLAGGLGFDPKSQLQAPLLDVMGNTGSVYAIMMFVAALEESELEDYMLLANYGMGADAFIF